jgi:hypothetical protein
MSKRGRILKEMKAHMAGILELTKEAANLPDEDGRWLWKKLEKFGEGYEKELEAVSRTLNNKNHKPDDLPF